MKYLVDGVNCFSLIAYEMIICWLFWGFNIFAKTHWDYFGYGFAFTFVGGLFTFDLINTIRETLKNKKLTIG